PHCPNSPCFPYSTLSRTTHAPLACLRCTRPSVLLRRLVGRGRSPHHPAERATRTPSSTTLTPVSRLRVHLVVRTQHIRHIVLVDPLRGAYGDLAQGNAQSSSHVQSSRRLSTRFLRWIRMTLRGSRMTRLAR